MCGDAAKGQQEIDQLLAALREATKSLDAEGAADLVAYWRGRQEEKCDCGRCLRILVGLSQVVLWVDLIAEHHDEARDCLGSVQAAFSGADYRLAIALAESARSTEVADMLVCKGGNEKFSAKVGLLLMQGWLAEAVQAGGAS